MGKYLNKISNKTLLKALVIVLELSAIGIVAYMLLLPAYPTLKYKVVYERQEKEIDFKDEVQVRERSEEAKNSLPQAEYAVSPYRVIIPKIGVNAPIVESVDSEYGLSRGAWRIPESSTPERGGNTVITGHRFRYLPPHNMTFYLFHKLERGDLVTVVWKEKDYMYRVRETRIIEPDNLSILNQTDKPVLTMFTCHPIYSTDQRLVVVADLVE